MNSEIRWNRLHTCWRLLISRCADVGTIRVSVPGPGPAQCHTRQTDQTALTCERDEFSHCSHETPQWNEKELITSSQWVFQLVISSECNWTVRNSEAVSPSAGALICPGANNSSPGEADPPEPRFSVFLCPTHSYESLTVKGSIVIQPNTGCSSCGKGESREMGVHVPQWTSHWATSFPAWSGLNMKWEGRPERKEMLPSRPLVKLTTHNTAVEILKATLRTLCYLTMCKG